MLRARPLGLLSLGLWRPSPLNHVAAPLAHVARRALGARVAAPRARRARSARGARRLLACDVAQGCLPPVSRLLLRAPRAVGACVPPGPWGPGRCAARGARAARAERVAYWHDVAPGCLPPLSCLLLRPSCSCLLPRPPCSCFLPQPVVPKHGDGSTVARCRGYARGLC